MSSSNEITIYKSSFQLQYANQISSVLIDAFGLKTTIKLESGNKKDRVDFPSLSFHNTYLEEDTNIVSV